MTAFVIDRVQARFRSAAPLPAHRVQGWADVLAAQDPGTLLGHAAAALGDDEWLLVRRLPLAGRWAEDASDAEIGVRWQHAVQAALQQALAAGGDAVLRYRHRVDAYTDLLYRSALGDTRRQWAWAQMGLLPPSAARAPLAPEPALLAGAEALGREPGWVWPVLVRLLAAETDCAAFGAVLRALPPAAWATLLQASRRTAPYLPAAADAGLPPRTPGDTGHRDPPPEAVTPLSGPAAELLAWARARPDLGASQTPVLAALLAALAWSGPPPSLGQGERRRLTAQRWLQDDGPAPRVPAAPPGQPVPPVAVSAGAIRAAAAPAGLRAAGPPPRRADDAPALPPLPEVTSAWQPTAWAGALFWLAQLPRGSLLARPGAPLPAVPPGLLLALVLALGVPEDDPATTAFCAGMAPSAWPPDARLPDHAERAAAQVQQWSDGLDAAAPDLPSPRLAAVCRRPGRIRIEPGWITLSLPLAGVHTAIRRLGLDLDPGWLPWWGSVLSIRYED